VAAGVGVAGVGVWVGGLPPPPPEHALTSATMPSASAR
jgi:hypothetical protein